MFPNTFTWYWRLVWLNAIFKIQSRHMQACKKAMLFTYINILILASEVETTVLSCIVQEVCLLDL